MIISDHQTDRKSSNLIQSSSTKNLGYTTHEMTHSKTRVNLIYNSEYQQDGNSTSVQFNSIFHKP